MAKACWLVLLLAACDGGGTALPPDGPPDAPPDASIETELTILTWTGDGAPDPTGIAVFADPSGSVIAHVTADAMGHVQTTVPPGSSVTVVQLSTDPLNATHEIEKLTTIRGIAPGDHLVAGLRALPGHKTGATTRMDVSYPPGNGGAPALYAACADDDPGNPGGPAALTFYASCMTPTFDLLAIGVVGGMRSFVYQTGLAYAAGGMLAVPNTWQAMDQNMTTVSNTPANLTRVAARLDAIVGGAPFEMDMRSVEVPGAGTNLLQLRYAPMAAPSLLVVNSVVGADVIDRQVQLATVPPSAPTVDLAAQPLPRALVVTKTATGLTWTETGTGTGSPDARVSVWAARWNDGAGMQHDVEWRIIEAPSATTTLTLPALPAALADHDPTVADAAHPRDLLAGAVFYVDYDNLAGYDAARGYGMQLSDVETMFLDVVHSAHATVGGR